MTLNPLPLHDPGSDASGPRLSAVCIELEPKRGADRRSGASSSPRPRSCGSSTMAMAKAPHAVLVATKVFLFDRQQRPTLVVRTAAEAGSYPADLDLYP